MNSKCYNKGCIYLNETKENGCNIHIDNTECNNHKCLEININSKVKFNKFLVTTVNNRSYILETQDNITILMKATTSNTVFYSVISNYINGSEVYIKANSIVELKEI